MDPFLSYRIPLEKDHLLLDALYPPIPRVIWDSIIKCPDIHLLLSTLAERQHSKRLGQEWMPHPAEIGGPIKNVGHFKMTVKMFQSLAPQFVASTAPVL